MRVNLTACVCVCVRFKRYPRRPGIAFHTSVISSCLPVQISSLSGRKCREMLSLLTLRRVEASCCLEGRRRIKGQRDSRQRKTHKIQARHHQGSPGGLESAFHNKPTSQDAFYPSALRPTLSSWHPLTASNLFRVDIWWQRRPSTTPRREGLRL